MTLKPLIAGIAAGAATLASLPALAQLSSPIAQGPQGQQGAQTPPAGAIGSGPGYHSPQSPIAPLQEREGVLSWKVLSSVTTKVEKNRVLPQFPANVRALNNKTVKVQGFMMPLEPGEKQRHFLLSSVPTTCSFCIPAGPEGLVEVKVQTPVRYSIDPVVVEGQLAVLDNDPYGLYYRITDTASK